MSSARQFNLNLDQFAKAVGNAANEVVRATSLKVLRAVAEKTPVDKGIALSGWTVGVNTMPKNKMDHVDKIKKGEKIGRSSALTDVASAGDKELGKIKASVGMSFPVVFIANYVPYVIRLEQGSSTQAPNGMAGLALREVQREISEFLKSRK